MKKQQKKCVIGRTEIIDFPELGLSGIEAKIDTGAYSTAIHAHKIWTDEEAGSTFLNFELFDPEKPHYRKLTIRTQNFRTKKVRSSNGRLEKRFAIKTKIKLGGRLRTTDLTLTNRGKMRYPVLVGRKVLSKGYLVDVSKKNLA